MYGILMMVAPILEPHSRAVPRVLHVVSAMNVGGAETMLMNLYRALDRRRLQFDFLLFSEERGAYDDEIERLGGRLLRMPLPAHLGSRKSVLVMEQIIRDEGPFLAVHAHVLHASSLALIAASRARVGNRIAHSHSTSDVGNSVTRRVYYIAARMAIRRYATSFVACGREAGEYLFGRGFRAHGVVVRNGVDMGAIQGVPMIEGENVRRELSVTEDEILLGCVARMEQVKNHSFTIQVLRACRDRELPVRLALVGDGALRLEIEQQVERAGLTERVSFLGIRRDIPRLLRAFDALLLPSLYEGLPVTLVEAQAAGLPCLVSSHVSNEADLGAGLIERLSIQNPYLWADRVAKLTRARDRSAAMTVAARSGYDVHDCVDEIYNLYGLAR
jgi:glycosyltransferase EpsF